MSGPRIDLRRRLAREIEFRRDRNRAVQVLESSMRALRDRDSQGLDAALAPTADRSVWYLATTGALGMLAAVLPEPIGRHECSEAICPLASQLLDLTKAGRRAAVSRLLVGFTQSADDQGRADLLGYFLAGLDMAVSVGLVEFVKEGESDG